MLACRPGAISRATPKGTIVRELPCRCWECIDCGPQRKRALMALARDGKPDTLLTLTVDPANFETKEEAHDALKHRYSDFVEMARKKWPKTRVEYLGVIEATKLGWPHFMRAPFIPQRSISRYFEKHGVGKIVDIRKVRGTRQVAAYVAKYLSKKPARFGDGKRYVRSQSWESQEAKAWRQENVKPHLWQLWDRAAFLVVEHLETFGHKFFECPSGGWLSPPIFGGSR